MDVKVSPNTQWHSQCEFGSVRLGLLELLSIVHSHTIVICQICSWLGCWLNLDIMLQGNFTEACEIILFYISIYVFSILITLPFLHMYWFLFSRVPFDFILKSDSLTLFISSFLALAPTQAVAIAFGGWSGWSFRICDGFPIEFGFHSVNEPFLTSTGPTMSVGVLKTFRWIKDVTKA